MVTIMPTGFLSKDKNKIINTEEIDKYKQPDFTTNDYGVPGKDTLETIKTRWKKDKRYKWAKILVIKTPHKENGMDVYEVKIKPGLLSTKEHDLRKQELRLFFTHKITVSPCWAPRNDKNIILSC